MHEVSSGGRARLMLGTITARKGQKIILADMNRV